MTINVYPGLMPCEPIESHEWTGTLAGWLQANGIDYTAQEVQPISVTVNGEVLPVEKWGAVDLAKGDDVQIRPLPHGGILKGLGSILGKIFNAVFGWLMPSQGGRDHGSPEQGQKLEVSSAKANQARLGEVVPELAGRFRRFPDYLTPPRRHFTSPREQWLEFHACVGPGSYQINAADVKVGDTPFSGLGSDAAYAIYPPGANLSAVSTHLHWHTVTEVGGTSSGTAGLELPVDMATSVNSDPAQYTFSGGTITRSSGSFPVGWGPGTIVSILLSRSLVYSVTGGGSFPPAPNVFSGDFAHLRPLANGDLINVSGAGLTGQYVVQNVSLNSAGVGSLELWTVPIPPSEGDPGTPSEPVTSVAPGNYTITTDAGPRNYTLTASSEEFITVTGSAFPAITAPATIKYAGGLLYGDWTSTFAASPAAEKTTLIEIDFFFPGGLGFVADDGELQNRTVRAEIQYRDMAVGGAFTSVMKVYTQATLDQIGFTEQIAVPSMRPEVRVRRVGATSTSTQVQDTIHWYGLKSRLPTRTSYPNWTTISIRIRSGGKLAAQSENQVNVIATRILPRLQSNGTWSAPTPTRDISAFFRYIAQTIGYTDDDLDMEELQRLHAIWVARGDTMDHVFDLTTVKQAMNTTLGAGMAELTIADGLIRPVRDEPRSQFEQGYSPQNMTGPLRRTFRARRHDDADGVEVEYTDGTTWTQQTVICALPGSQRLKLEKIKLNGVTSRTRAWRIGMRRARTIRYRNWDYSFETEMDALNSEYLSYVPLFDDIPGYGQSALLEHIEPAGDGAMLHVSEPLKWEEGHSHVVAYRRPDGTLAGPWPAAPGIDEYSVIAHIPQPWPVVTLKHELTHVYFGTAERWSFPALITEINPNGIERARVSAVNYAPDVYADDDNFPPN